MDAINDPNVETIAVMTSAQIGKTEVINNIIGYHIDHDPCPILVLQPTLEMGEAYSKDRIAPMVRDTPAITNKVSDPKSKGSGNTLLHKVFAGGHLTISGANSPASLASRPIRLVLCDEVDRYPISAGTEGDPVSLARKRTVTFWNRKIVLTSTPTIRGMSRIEAEYERSDRRRYYVPCPHCEGLQTLKFSGVIWDKPDGKHKPETAQYVCEHCGAMIEERHKPAMLARGEWIAEGEPGKIAGFHLNELYSPWRRWGQVVEDFLAAKVSRETLKTWTNTSLGETFEEEMDAVDHGPLFGRREAYEQPPEDVLVLVAGIDVQDDRLEMEVVGYGRGEESWGIERVTCWGDPKHKQVWAELDEALGRVWETADGRTLGIAAACVDSGGHHTQIVYDFCGMRAHRRIYPVKGRGMDGQPLISAPTKVKIGRDTRWVHLYHVGVNDAKSTIYSRLKLTELGPGYCHFPIAYDEEYFAQLTAEKIHKDFRKGFERREWIKTRPRNEALDIRVYAMAALRILKPNWDKLARNMHRAEPKAEAPKVEESPIVQKPPARRPAQRGRGFVTGWKNRF